MPHLELPAMGLDDVECVLARDARFADFSSRVFSEFKCLFLTSLLVALFTTLLGLLFLFEEFDSLGLLRNCRDSPMSTSRPAWPPLGLSTLVGVASSLDFFFGEESVVGV